MIASKLMNRRDVLRVGWFLASGGAMSLGINNAIESVDLLLERKKLFDTDQAIYSKRIGLIQAEMANSSDLVSEYNEDISDLRAQSVELNEEYIDKGGSRGIVNNAIEAALCGIVFEYSLSCGLGMSGRSN